MNERLKTLVDNASLLSKTDQKAFAMVRRMGFGASDASILLGVNPFPNGTIKLLIEQKRSDTLTADEVAIGQMVNVRKGSDLEPLILQKFQEKYMVADNKLKKPEAMYGIKGTQLTVNFDGVLSLGILDIPVEIKYVSTYGEKYYEFSKCMGPVLDYNYDGEVPLVEVVPEYVAMKAKQAGIPVYYYTQLQQQMMALNAPFGYLCVLLDKTWEIKVFKVSADKNIWDELATRSNDLWKQVEA